MLVLDQYIQVHLVPRASFFGIGGAAAALAVPTATLGTPDVRYLMSFIGAQSGHSVTAPSCPLDDPEETSVW